MLTVLSANIQGLCPSRGKYKLAMLKEMAIEENVGVIALTESHLNPSFHEGEISISQFTPYRADRCQGTLKGGVILYIRDCLSPGAKLMCSGSHGNIEYAVLQVPVASLTIVCVYRTPTANFNDFYHVISKIDDCILQNPSLDSLIFCGDLNFPHLKWPSATIEGGTRSARNQAQRMLSLFSDHFLEQIIEKPTRGDNILDLFAVNNHQLVLDYQVMPKSAISDHNLILISTTQYLTSEESSTPISVPLFSLDFENKDIDWSKVKSQFANINWDQKLENQDPDAMLQSICSIIEEVCLKIIPRKRLNIKRNMPRERRKFFRKKSKLIKKLNSITSQAHRTRILTEIQRLDGCIIESHRDEISNKEAAAIRKIQSDSKYFFRYAKSKSSTKSSVGPIKSQNGLTSDPREISEILKGQFEAVFSEPSNTTSIEMLLQEPGPRCLEDLEFDEEDIAKAIKTIPTHSAPGPDGIPARVLRECTDELKKPIYILWRSSLNNGYVPVKLKQSNVIPIFKKGDRSLPLNYRPISLVSHISKIFEKVVVKALTSYLNELDLFNEQQHGFRGGRSCLSQLLEHQQQVLAILAAQGNADVIYLDFAKAFDKVDYGILLNKLKSMGVCGTLLKWLHSFLTGRKQAVSVDGFLSSEGPVVSGVPQGSSLGPLLFLIHISDIDVGTEHASVSSFADDTRLLMPIYVADDSVKMQSDLNKIYDWAKENNMSFNSDKFELLRYKVNNVTLAPYCTPDGSIIGEATQVKDLGVCIDNSGTFEAHITEAIKQGKNMASWTMRVFSTREILPMMTLFRSMVLPQLEYCCQLWSPVHLKNIRRLEAIQRSFTARIAGLNHLNYWERLVHLKLYSLERRRERYLILYVYKIINRLAPNLRDDRFAIKPYYSVRGDKLCRIPIVSRSPSAKIRSMVECSFAVNGAKLFNCLPSQLRNHQGSFDSFKYRLDKLLEKIHDKPCTPGYHQSAPSNSIGAQLDQMRADGIFL